MASKPTIKRWLILAAVFFALCTAIIFLSSLGESASGMASKSSSHQHAKQWYGCGLLALAVVWVCDHNRLERGRTRWVLFHVLSAVLLGLIYMAGTAWWIAGEQSIMHPGKILTFPYLVKQAGHEYFGMSVFVYFVTVFSHLVWDYYQRFREREVQTAQLHRELVEARLDALRMQLNPHFLFNTLHAISSLIHDQPEAADRMVARLSGLLRLSLDTSKPQEVPLSEEMGFLEGYLEIEQTRFSERLQVTKEIQPGTETALVPFLLLQPLVENAIRHGIEPREQRGCLVIGARRQGDRLELWIRDDGPGLPKEPAKASGIGLSNTRSRLKHLYGERFTFELKDLAEGGLEARISLPYRTHAKAS